MQIVLEGCDRPVPAHAGDTLLAALLRAGLPFPFSCQSGNCGTCKCELVSGEVEMLEYAAHTLSPSERSRGVVLACRTLLRGDAVVRRID
jgi:naphthalene 1,2-dioxygenase ferredoxin reductase component